jgi:Tol biopolymer transport system component/predicted Ser/Thr protein kinase
LTLSAGTRLGPYEVLAPLGAGGMGEVYRARDTRLGRDVAIKVLPSDLAEVASRRSRFEKEARAASALNHPNIVTIHEIARVDETSVIVMELVEGKTLREWLLSGPLPTRRLLAIAAQIADGLARAHEAGIVHRDLKPENLMVTRDGLVKILDFGLAKLTDTGPGTLEASHLPTETGTSAGTVLGTVGYMSPEQASGQPADYRSDQFALGSILHEMASGKRSFARTTAAETLSAIIREDPEPLARLRPDSPPPLRWIVERCLAKDPADRYVSTRDLARELGSLRDHVSETAGSDGGIVAAPGRKRLLRMALAALLSIAGLAAAYVAGHGGASKTTAPTFHRLTFRTGSIGNARFAPDGRTVIYGATWEGESGRHLYQTSPESPESRRFEYPDADILAISTAGEMAVLFDLLAGRPTLSRVPLVGGTPRPVLEGARYAGADWAPNGRDLAVIRLVEERYRLEAPIGTVLLQSAEGLEAPRFSQSGDRIAVFQFGPKRSLLLVETASRTRRTLSEGWTSLTGVPCWGPDGKEIWFTASRGNEPEAIYAVGLSGKERLIVRVPGYLELDDVSAEGRVLVAHHTSQHALMGRAPGESRERDLSWLDWSSPTDLSADGRTLVFTERGEGGEAPRAVYIRETDGSPAVRLGEGTSGSLSPDGKWVTTRVSGRPGSAPRLVLLPTGAGESKTVPTEGLDFFGAGAWLQDGRRLLLAGAEKGRPARVFIVQIESGERRPVTPEGISLPPGAYPIPIPPVGEPVSPDGAHFLAIDGKRDLFVGAIDGGQTRRVASLGPRERVVQWSADGRSVILWVGEPIKLALLDAHTGERRPWKEILPSAPWAFRGIRRVLLSRDGEAYAYATERFVSELFLVDGLK